MEKVKPKDFGKDHWSLLAYIETRCVDYKGTLDMAHLRVKNPALQTRGASWKPEYGTRLRGYFLDDGGKDASRQILDHDDLDCFDDLEEAGYIENTGTGLFPACQLTKLGHRVASKLREHKSNGSHFATFVWEK